MEVKRSLHSGGKSIAVFNDQNKTKEGSSEAAAFCSSRAIQSLWIYFARGLWCLSVVEHLHTADVDRSESVSAASEIQGSTVLWHGASLVQSIPYNLKKSCWEQLGRLRYCFGQIGLIGTPMRAQFTDKRFGEAEEESHTVNWVESEPETVSYSHCGAELSL